MAGLKPCRSLGVPSVSRVAYRSMWSVDAALPRVSTSAVRASSSISMTSSPRNLHDLGPGLPVANFSPRSSTLPGFLLSHVPRTMYSSKRFYFKHRGYGDVDFSLRSPTFTRHICCTRPLLALAPHIHHSIVLGL
jgi:hypothetical protein